MACYINRMPPEVLSHILTFAPYLNNKGLLSMSALLNASLVCQLWRPLAQSVIYQEISPEHQLVQKQHLESLLLSIDRHGLRSLSLFVVMPMMAAVGKHAREMDSSWAVEEDLEERRVRKEVVKRARGVRTLRLRNFRWTWAELLSEESLKDLQKLAFIPVNDGGFELPSRPNATAPDPIALFHPAPPAFSLTSLTLGQGKLPSSILRYLRPSLSTIQKLSLWPITLEHPDEYVQFLDGLVDADQLRTLRLTCETGDFYVGPLLDRLPNFNALEELKLKLRPNQLHPMFFADVLARLPASIKRVELTNDRPHALLSDFEMLAVSLISDRNFLPNLQKVHIRSELGKMQIDNSEVDWKRRLEHLEERGVELFVDHVFTDYKLSSVA